MYRIANNHGGMKEYFLAQRRVFVAGAATWGIIPEFRETTLASPAMKGFLTVRTLKHGLILDLFHLPKNLQAKIVHHPTGLQVEVQPGESFFLSRKILTAVLNQLLNTEDVPDDRGSIGKMRDN
jgi:hypothetical protein